MKFSSFIYYSIKFLIAFLLQNKILIELLSISNKHEWYLFSEINIKRVISYEKI